MVDGFTHLCLFEERAVIPCGVDKFLKFFHVVLLGGERLVRL